MNGRTVLTGKTRTCPHCKATILDSASVCPACRHHLRFDSKAIAQRRVQPSFSALRVEGRFGNPSAADSSRPAPSHPSSPGSVPSGPAPLNQIWEYSVVVSIRNDRGEEVARQVVGVGALPPNESRTVTLSVDVFTPEQAEK